MGYGDWLIKRYPQLRFWSSADLHSLIAKAKWQTRFTRVLACAVCLEAVVFCALHLLKDARSGSWIQEAVVLVAIIGTSFLVCDRVQSAIVKLKLSATVRGSLSQSTAA